MAATQRILDFIATRRPDGPCMILVGLLGMNATTAFPIMMGSCAFLMPVSGLRFIARGQSKYARRIATENVVFAPFGEERQIPDRRWQIEIPMGIIGGIHQLRFRIDHAEGIFQRAHILNFHRLR